jgi:hypothetical protein
MKLRTRLTNRGVEIFLGRNLPSPLTPSKDADQVKPRGWYVYAHVDSAGKMFYIGYGTGRRAWSRDRHPLWHRYVEKHLNGKYRVLILQDNLSASKAEEIESDWIAQSEGLVNWQNMGRHFDLKAIDLSNKLRDANRTLIQQAKLVEKTDMEKAAQMYIQAIDAIAGYALIKDKSGIVAQLLEEEEEELGRNGQVEPIDRLTMCLVKLGRVREAVQRSEDYFKLYRRDSEMGAFQRIQRRLEKARLRER